MVDWITPLERSSTNSQQPARRRPLRRQSNPTTAPKTLRKERSVNQKSNGEVPARALPPSNTRQSTCGARPSMYADARRPRARAEAIDAADDVGAPLDLGVEPLERRSSRSIPISASTAKRAGGWSEYWLRSKALRNAPRRLGNLPVASTMAMTPVFMLRGTSPDSMGGLWRLGAESNRCTRLCRPLHDHSAT